MPTASTPADPSPVALPVRASVQALGLADLHPANFAIVMATGVVSMASHFLGMRLVAEALLWVNVAAYAVLVALFVLRACLYGGRALADLVDHQRGVAYFTAIAGTSVLGNQVLVLHQWLGVAKVLFFVALGLWLVLLYTVFTALTVKQQKPTLEAGISGGWLLSVVATQSVAILATRLPAAFPGREAPLLFLALGLWLCGAMLYIWIISLIFYRYLFFPFVPSDLSPPYWINMGAMAISTLAGATLIETAGLLPLLTDLLPFLKGFTLFFWATATWWVPMLVILALWRHVYRRFPLRYDPLYWGAVFPLGMYTLCTLKLARVMEAPFLAAIPGVFIYLALAAWLAAFVGLAGRVAASVRFSIAAAAA